MNIGHVVIIVTITNVWSEFKCAKDLLERVCVLGNSVIGDWKRAAITCREAEFDRGTTPESHGLFHSTLEVNPGGIVLSIVLDFLGDADKFSIRMPTFDGVNETNVLVLLRAKVHVDTREASKKVRVWHR